VGLTHGAGGVGAAVERGVRPEPLAGLPSRRGRQRAPERERERRAGVRSGHAVLSYLVRWQRMALFRTE
jgi:hypothetical protein